MTASSDLATAFRKALLDKVVWKPISVLPEEGKVSLITNGERRCVGIFKGGEWKREKGQSLTFATTHWMAFRDE